MSWQDDFTHAQTIAKRVDHSEEDTLVILTYELGMVARSWRYAHVRAEDEAERRAYLANMRIELADLIIQSLSLADKQGWPIEDLLVDGAERFKERIQEVANAKRARERETNRSDA